MHKLPNEITIWQALAFRCSSFKEYKTIVEPLIDSIEYKFSAITQGVKNYPDNKLSKEQIDIIETVVDGEMSSIMYELIHNVQEGWECRHDYNKVAKVIHKDVFAKLKLMQKNNKDNDDWEDEF